MEGPGAQGVPRWAERGSAGKLFGLWRAGLAKGRATWHRPRRLARLHVVRPLLRHRLTASPRCPIAAIASTAASPRQGRLFLARVHSGPACFRPCLFVPAVACTSVLSELQGGSTPSPPLNPHVPLTSLASTPPPLPPSQGRTSDQIQVPGPGAGPADLPIYRQGMVCRCKHRIARLTWLMGLACVASHLAPLRRVHTAANSAARSLFHS